MKGSNILTSVCVDIRVLYTWHLTYTWQDLAMSQNLLFQLTAKESKMVFWQSHKQSFQDTGCFASLMDAWIMTSYKWKSVSFLLLDSRRCIPFNWMKSQVSGCDFPQAQLYSIIFVLHKYSLSFLVFTTIPISWIKAVLPYVTFAPQGLVIVSARRHQVYFQNPWVQN